MTVRKNLIALLAIVFATAGTQQAMASLITSVGDLSGPTVIDFSQFGAFQFTAGPVQIGGLVGEDVTWESTSSNSVIGNGSYNLGGNGTWTAGRDGYTGTNSDTAEMTYRFNDGPVNGVGGFMNYTINFDGPSDAFIFALDNERHGDRILQHHEPGSDQHAGSNQWRRFPRHPARLG